MTSFKIEKAIPAFLDEKRKRTDPRADQLISSIIKAECHPLFSLRLKELSKNDSFSSQRFADFPKPVRNEIEDYFTHTSKIPDWADEYQISIGQDVFSRYVPLIMMILQYKSLPLCYSCKNGAKILHLTGRLTSRYGGAKVFGRLVETAQMVINTMSPGGLQPKGSGIITVQKVRLIHSLVRFFVKSPRHNQHSWDVAEMGEPINQEDLAGTLMSFAPMVINGLEQLGINLSREEKDAYMHCWKVIGYLTGLDEDLLPNTYEEGWELAIRILRHQAAPSVEGIELTKSCIDLPKRLSGGLFQRDISDFILCYFLNDTSKAIGLDIREMVGVQQSQNNYKTIIQLISKLAAIGSINKAFLKGYLKFNNLSKKISLSVPTSLTKA